MKNNRRAPIFILLLISSFHFCFIGCTPSSDDNAGGETSADASQTDGDNEDSDTQTNNPGSESKAAIENAAEGSNSDGMKDFETQELLSSPFTKERVIMLNAIVRKSLDIINEYDDVRRAFEKTDNASSADFQSKLKEFSKKALAVRNEMDEAKKDLVSSGEKYNEAIFAGMVKFVVDVDNELRNKIETMEKSSAANSEKEVSDEEKDTKENGK